MSMDRGRGALRRMLMKMKREMKMIRRKILKLMIFFSPSFHLKNDINELHLSTRKIHIFETFDSGARLNPETGWIRAVINEYES